MSKTHTHTISDPDLGEVEVRVLPRATVERIRRGITAKEVRRRAKQFSAHPNRELRQLVKEALFEFELLYEAVVDAAIRDRLWLRRDEGHPDPADVPAIERLAAQVEQASR